MDDYRKEKEQLAIEYMNEGKEAFLENRLNEAAILMQNAINSFKVVDVRLAGHDKFQSKETNSTDLGNNELHIYKMDEDAYTLNVIENTFDYIKFNFNIKDFCCSLNNFCKCASNLCR